MTSQEKLAAELRTHASDCRKAADLNTDAVLQFDQLAAMAEAMDSAATTLLSEHGGGGGAEPAGHHHVYKDPFGSGSEVIVHNNGGEWNGQKPLRSIPYYYTTPPTPSAPDRVNCVECEGEGFTYGDDGETTIPCLPCGGSGLQKAAPPSAPAPAAEQPEGKGAWKLVPVVPTEAMIEAAEQMADDIPLSDWGKIVDPAPAQTYAAMLAAAPTQEKDNG